MVGRPEYPFQESRAGGGGQREAAAAGAALDQAGGGGRKETAADAALDPALEALLVELRDVGRAIWERFDRDVRQHEWHPFFAADYDRVLRTLLSLREPGLRFLEWGSATGVITIMADLLGFEACGIEIDGDLVATARELAARFRSSARFAIGSFVPDGYEWQSSTGDRRLGTIEHGPPGYPELGYALDDFDLVFAYPWSGEEPIMIDVMRRRGRPGARLLLHGSHSIEVYRDGRRVG